MEQISIKIKRHTYEITNKDSFLDNGACVQLITQSKEKANWGHRPNPILSKKTIKELLSYNHTRQDSDTYPNCTEIRINIEN